MINDICLVRRERVACLESNTSDKLIHIYNRLSEMLVLKASNLRFSGAKGGCSYLYMTSGVVLKNLYLLCLHFGLFQNQTIL